MQFFNILTNIITVSVYILYIMNPLLFKYTFSLSKDLLHKLTYPLQFDAVMVGLCRLRPVDISHTHTCTLTLYSGSWGIGDLFPTLCFSVLGNSS